MIKYKNTDVKCNGHLRTLLFPQVTVVTPSNNYSYVFARVLHSLVYFIPNSLLDFLLFCTLDKVRYGTYKAIAASESLKRLRTSNKILTGMCPCS